MSRVTQRVRGQPRCSGYARPRPAGAGLPAPSPLTRDRAALFLSSSAGPKFRLIRGVSEKGKKWPQGPAPGSQSSHHAHGGGKLFIGHLEKWPEAPLDAALRAELPCTVLGGPATCSCLLSPVLAEREDSHVTPPVLAPPPSCATAEWLNQS